LNHCEFDGNITAMPVRPNVKNFCLPARLCRRVHECLGGLLPFSVLAGMCFASCAPEMRPYSASAPGSRAGAAPRALVLEQAYVRKRVGTVAYPAGRYAAEFSDSGGTFYAAPTKVVRSFVGSELMDGGFYVPFAHPAEIQAYFVSNEDHTPIKLLGANPGMMFRFER